MIDTVCAAVVVDDVRFEYVGAAADAHSAARVREEFAEWLERFFDLDPIRSGDLVLAINEALANVAEFAYLSAERPKTMDLVARYDADQARLTATISDRGVWRAPQNGPAGRTRGRGIPLIRALSDRASIETSTGGTDVRMQWDAITR